LAWSTTGHAGITDFQYTSDYVNFSCSANISYNLDHSVGFVDMDAYQLVAGPGHMAGTILTDTPVDPSLVLSGVVDNDTGFSWNGYRIRVYMDRAFTLSGVSVGTPPSGWTFSQTPAALNATPVFYGAGEYVAQIDYTGGAPVPTGGEFHFSYTLNFSGSTHYSFDAEMTPVPEPATASLALIGGLLFGGFRLARRSRK
jgi:hypothetical protein